MEYLTLQQTADLLQVSYDQLWLMVKKGDPHPPFFFIGQRKRFIREQVLEWAKQQAAISSLGTGTSHAQ